MVDLDNIKFIEPNYIVVIRDWNGRKEVPCVDESEVWDAIGSRAFGGLYEVYSPTGMDCNEFIPF